MQHPQSWFGFLANCSQRVLREQHSQHQDNDPPPQAATVCLALSFESSQYVGAAEEVEEFESTFNRELGRRSDRCRATREFAASFVNCGSAAAIVRDAPERVAPVMPMIVGMVHTDAAYRHDMIMAIQRIMHTAAKSRSATGYYMLVGSSLLVLAVDRIETFRHRHPNVIRRWPRVVVGSFVRGDRQRPAA